MPILGVNIAIIQDGKVLLTKRRDFEVWCLPGGEVDNGETLAEAAKREAREEVGLDVQLERLVGIHSRPQWLSVGSHVVVFSASVVGGELTIQTQEVMEARFFSLDELPDEMLLGHHQQILDTLNGVYGAVWTHESEWNFNRGLPARSFISYVTIRPVTSQFYQQRIGKDIPDGDRLEVQGKVDVY